MLSRRAFPRIRSLARALTRRGELESTLSTELEFHLEARAVDLERSGLGPEAARRQAVLELGARETYREQCREARGLRLVDELSADLRYAWRSLKNRPGFAVVAVSILSLAMGVNLAFFTFFDAYGLRPLPIPNAERYVDLFETTERGERTGLFTRQEVESLRLALEPAFEGLYGANFFHLPMLEPASRMVHGQAVSANFFTLLGGRPELGRAFLPEEDRPGAGEAAAVLSDSGWQRLFGRDPSALGKKIRLGTTWFTLVGVMEPTFLGVEPITPALWIPLGAHEALAGSLTDPPRYDLAGILRVGTSIDGATRLATAALPALERPAEGESAPSRMLIERRKSWLQSDARRGLSGVAALIFAAFLLVLAIACANLASLHLARATARHREIATRLSLGSSRSRLVRQLLTESLLLAGLAGFLGSLMAVASIEAIQTRLFEIVTAAGVVMTPVTLHWHLFAYAIGLALAAALAFGLLPALEVTSPDLAGGARRDGLALGGRLRPQRLTGLLITAQVAASLVLLTLAGLMIRNTQLSSRLDVGFESGRLVDVRFPNPTPEVAQRLRESPKVAALSAVARIPLSGSMARQPMQTEGKSQMLRFNVVDEAYFQTLGIELVAGRSFWPEEARATAAVVVVSAATAQRLWPGVSALGRTLELPTEAEGGVMPPGTYEVVGVAADVVSGLFFQGPDSSAVYFPGALGTPSMRELIARPTGDPASFVLELGDLCQQIDPAVLCQPKSLEEMANFQRFPFLAASFIASALGLLALVLTSIGLYGTVAFAVVQRLREVGVRIALGASPGQVLRSVLSRAMRSVVWGLAFGLPACWLLSRMVTKLFTILGDSNALSLVVTSLLLLAVALVAALIPARRAMSADPVLSLRAD